MKPEKHTDAYLTGLSWKLDEVAHGTRAGLTAEQIGERLGVSDRTVDRYRRYLASLGVPIEKPERTPRHGTYTEYARYLCRCAECRAASSAYKRSLRGKPVTTHGSAGYLRGCRCDICYGYMSASNKRQRQRRIERGRAA